MNKISWAFFIWSAVFHWKPRKKKRVCPFYTIIWILAYCMKTSSYWVIFCEFKFSIPKKIWWISNLNKIIQLRRNRFLTFLPLFFKDWLFLLSVKNKINKRWRKRNCKSLEHFPISPFSILLQEIKIFTRHIYSL